MMKQFFSSIKNKIKESVKAPSTWILFFCILVCMMVHPFGILGSQTLQSDAYTSGMQPNITFEKNTVVIGEFTPSMDGLQEIAFRFLTKGKAPDGKVKVEICNKALTALETIELESGAVMNYHDTEIPISVTLLKDTTYFYRITAKDYDDAELSLYCGTKGIGPAETGKCMVSDVSDNKEVPGILYTYHTRCTPSGIPAWYACILLFGLVLCAVFRKYDKSKFVPFLFVLFIGICLIQMSDESAKPIIIHADEMNVISGYSDDRAIGLTPDSEFDGTFLRSGDYLLDAGKYRLGISYRTNQNGNVVKLDNGDEKIKKIPLSAKESYVEETFLLEESCENFSFCADYDGKSEILIDSFTLIPETQFYTDTEFLAWVWIVSALLIGFMYLYMSRSAHSVNSKFLFTGLLLIGAMASVPYIRSGLSWAVDLCYHLVRIEGIKDALAAGQFPVILYPKALEGNGYLNVMYPSLFLHIPAYLRLLGVSLADSFKFLMILFHFATAFITFHCVYSMKNNSKAAFLAAAVYTLCPYRFTNLYARGAIGEFMAMTFFPLIFAGLYHILLGTKRKWTLLTIGMIGLLGCHILSAVYATAFCVLVCFIFVLQLFKEYRWLALLEAATASVLLALGFLVPFWDYYKSDVLWMQALDFGSFYKTALNLSGLLGMNLKGGYYGLTLGLPVALLGIFACLALVSGADDTDDHCFAYCKVLTILGIVLTFMVLAFFPAKMFEGLPGWSFLLGKSQFAWRLLGPASLLLTMAGSIALFSKESLKRFAPAFMVCVLVLSVLSATRFEDEDYAYGEEVYTIGHAEKIVGIPKTSNTVVYPFEWRPLYTNDSDLETEIIPSDENLVKIKEYKKENYTTTFSYTCSAKEQDLEIPVHCYPGYVVTDETGTPIAITRGHNGRIKMNASNDGKLHTITVTYHMPQSYVVTTWISILTAIMMFAGSIIFKIRKHLKETKNA